MNGYKFCPNYRVSCPNIYLLNPCPQIQKAYPRFQNWIYFIDNNNICVCLYNVEKFGSRFYSQCSPS